MHDGGIRKDCGMHRRRHITKSQSPNPKFALTLLELLIVMAIIGILIGLLLPVVQGARESARRVTCSNNLKQLSLAMLAHESAHEFLPHGGWGWTFTGDPDGGFGVNHKGG
jgi:prepilin-type N-terminal cleavage/methylation domain-containing protein